VSVGADLDVRVPDAETLESGHQPHGAERGADADGQHPALAVGAHLRDPLGQLVEALAERRQGRLAGIGQAQCPGQAAEQGHLEEVLERFDLVADRGRRDVQLGGGLGEAEEARGRLESAQGVQRRQTLWHEIYLSFSNLSYDNNSCCRQDGKSLFFQSIGNSELGDLLIMFSGITKKT